MDLASRKFPGVRRVGEQAELEAVGLRFPMILYQKRAV